MLTIAVATVWLVAPAGAATPYCGIMWGSLAKSASPMTAAPVTGVRTGQHSCYDRLVVDLAGAPEPGYFVRYVSQVVQEGSGEPIPLRGGAFIQVSVLAPASAAYHPSNPREAAAVTGFRTFRQVAFAGSFEGRTQFGLGVRARLPFRVFTLPGPGAGSRLVVDVAHRWS
ncbi:MAG: hypothetical protein HYX34_04855 [Actinobacteria bacterium]|nr:hypothetical protein [Actinomycetota bacterium]